MNNTLAKKHINVLQLVQGLHAAMFKQTKIPVTISSAPLSTYQQCGALAGDADPMMVRGWSTVVDIKCRMCRSRTETVALSSSASIKLKRISVLCIPLCVTATSDKGCR